MFGKHRERLVRRERCTQVGPLTSRARLRDVESRCCGNSSVCCIAACLQDPHARLQNNQYLSHALQAQIHTSCSDLEDKVTSAAKGCEQATMPRVPITADRRDLKSISVPST